MFETTSAPHVKFNDLSLSPNRTESSDASMDGLLPLVQAITFNYVASGLSITIRIFDP